MKDFDILQSPRRNQTPWTRTRAKLGPQKKENASFAMRKRKFSQTVTKAPGSIDLMNFINRRRIKRETKQHSAFISLVLLIVGYNTQTQKENRENLAAIPSIANFNILFCYESLEGVPTVLSIGRRLDLVDNCSAKVRNNANLRRKTVVLFLAVFPPSKLINRHLFPMTEPYNKKRT